MKNYITPLLISILHRTYFPLGVVRYLQEIAKEYKVEWTSTDIGLGVPTTVTDDEGTGLAQNRCIRYHRFIFEAIIEIVRTRFT